MPSFLAVAVAIAAPWALALAPDPVDGQRPGARPSSQDPAPFLLSPPVAAGPVEVEVGFFLTDLNEIELHRHRIVMEGILTARWRDPRLTFDPAVEGVEEKFFQGDYQFSEVATGWWPQLVLVNGSGLYTRQGQLLRHRYDGWMTYVEQVNAGVEVPAELRRFPFETEPFEIVFTVLGHDRSEVRLEVDSASSGHRVEGLSMAGWDLTGYEVRAREYDPGYLEGHVEAASSVVIDVEVSRQPGFWLRVVVLPMTLLVMLTWSVFWMDQSSLGDRMAISFLGILAVVAYQLTVSSSLPAIPYFTLMSAYIYISFVTACASVVVNLRVSHLDRSARRDEGNRLDARCRWLFPGAYFGSLALAAAYFLVRY
jgi:hypothetical protein